MRQKEEMRREKEAARLKAASDRATARRIAREYMELIEDERLELMELAASNKGLSSIVALDNETLQQLDMFRGLFITVILLHLPSLYYCCSTVFCVCVLVAPAPACIGPLILQITSVSFSQKIKNKNTCVFVICA